MNTSYPRLGQIFRVSLPALLLSRLLILPIIGPSLPYVGIVVAETALLCFLALYIRRHRLATEDLLLFNATPMPTLLMTIPLAACCSFVVAEFDLYLAQFLSGLEWAMPLSFQKNLLELQIFNEFAEIPGGLIALVILPAFCEELFFRGFVLTGLYAHYGPRWALSGSALFFAISHFNPWQFIPLFVFGLFLGSLVYWTHSIYPALLAHAINNLVSVVGVNFSTYWGIESLNPNQHLPISWIIVVGLLLLAGLVFISRQATIMPLLISRQPREKLPAAYPPSVN